MSIQSQIENYTGSIPSGLSSSDLKALIASGVSDIIRKVKMVNPNELWLFTRTANVSESGLSVDTALIYDVALGGKPCKNIPIHLRHRANDEDSIEYATGEFPVYYVYDGKVHVLPTPGVVGSYTVSSWASYDANGVGSQTTVTTSDAMTGVSTGDWVLISKSDESSSSTTDKYYIGLHRVFKYVSNTEIIIDRDYSSEPTTTGYEVENIVASCTYVNIPTASGIDETADTVDYFPNQYLGSLILYGAMQVLQKRISDMYNSLPTLSLPVAPAAPVLVETSETMPVFNAPAAFVSPAAPSGGNIDYTDVPTRPSVTTFLSPPITAFTFPLDTISIDNLVIDELPAPPVAPSFGSGSVDFTTTVRNKIPTYTKPSFVLPAFPTINTLSLPNVPVGPGGPSFSDAQSSVASTDVPVYIPAVMPDLNFAQADTFIVTEEDSELASAQLQEIQAKIGKMQAESQEQLAKFNADLNEYKSKLEESMSNVKNQLESDNSEYSAKLAQYQAEVQAYQIDTNNIIAKWGKEEIEYKFSKWSQECTQGIQLYQNNIQNEINAFNRDSVEYQAEIQKAAQDSQSVLTKDMNEYQSILSKYQAELESYKSKTNNQITEWTTKNVQSKMTEFTTRRNDELQKWNTENALALQKHSQDVQQATENTTAEINLWNSEITKSLQTFQAEDSSATALFQAEFQEEMSRFDADLKSATEVFNSAVNKFNADVNKVTEINSSRLNKANVELQSWTAESQNAVQDFTADITKDEKEFNFYINQYQTLKNEYDSSFMVEKSKEQ